MEFQLQRGATLGRYQLLSELGRGGMASVWVAHERGPGGPERLVAVKAMLPALANRDDFRKMFLEEGQIVRSIKHANVVSVFDVAEDYGVLYMAMEWVEGDSVRAIIREARKRRAIPPEMAVRMIADTAAGLHAAHELRDWDGRPWGLVHCDVSPHNILIGLNGDVKLVDFGVASATARTDNKEDLLKGKVGYMSPEQVLGTGLDRRSDVFSLGVVLYELTTGERLFRGSAPKDTLMLVAKAEVPLPSDVHQGYPKPLEAIVLKALARDAEARFQTAEALRAALDSYLVTERILVPKAGVGRLLRRVLGARIEQQREAIRDALHALDGSADGHLLPDEPVGARDSAHELSLSGRSFSLSTGNLSLSGKSWTTTPQATSHPLPEAPSDRTGAVRPQTLEPAPHVATTARPRAALVAVVVAAAALAAATVWLVTRSHAGPEVAVSAPASVPPRSGVAPELAHKPPVAVAPPAGPPGAESDATLPEALPLDAPTATLQPAPRRNPTSPNKKSQPTHEATPLAPKVAPEASVAADPKPAPPQNLPPLSERPSLNRGAAISALTSASSRATECRALGGPSGPGQAAVTFHPDGYVSSVQLSAPYQGTKVGTCVAGNYRKGKIPPFNGSPLTLTASFRVPE